MVTHDRYFLDSVSNRIAEIDKGKIYSYDTNYSGFLELKAQREEMEAATERKRRVDAAGGMRSPGSRRGCQSAFHQAEGARLERYEETAGPGWLRQQRRSGGDEFRFQPVWEIRRLSLTACQQGLRKPDACLIRDFSYIFLKNDRDRDLLEPTAAESRR